MDFTGEVQLGDVVRIEGEFVVAFGVAESPGGNSRYGSPPGPYFSMKKSRQKSLGEDPETPNASVHPARKRYAFPERD